MEGATGSGPTAVMTTFHRSITAAGLLPLTEQPGNNRVADGLTTSRYGRSKSLKPYLYSNVQTDFQLQVNLNSFLLILILTSIHYLAQRLL